MTVKASSVIPAEAYRVAKAEAWRARNYAVQQSRALSGTINGRQVVEIHQTLHRFKASIESYRTILGLLEWARSQERDGTYDPVAEFLVLINLLDVAIATIETTPPGSLLSAWTLAGVQWSTFQPAQTAKLKSDLDAIAAQVE